MVWNEAETALGQIVAPYKEKIILHFFLGIPLLESKQKIGF